MLKTSIVSQFGSSEFGNLVNRPGERLDEVEVEVLKSSAGEEAGISWRVSSRANRRLRQLHLRRSFRSLTFLASS